MIDSPTAAHPVSGDDLLDSTTPAAVGDVITLCGGLCADTTPTEDLPVLEGELVSVEDCCPLCCKLCRAIAANA